MFTLHLGFEITKLKESVTYIIILLVLTFKVNIQFSTMVFKKNQFGPCVF